MNILENYKQIGIVFNNIKAKGIISHSYIIETLDNPDGYEIAQELANIILEYDILNKNESRKLTEVESHPDFKVINPDNNNIKKESLIELQDEFNKTAIFGKRKVYMINGAEKLNPSSSNSILKFLEEPVKGITAILIVANRYQLLETILSRCQIISLKRNNDKSVDTKNKLIELTTSKDKADSIFIDEDKNAIETTLKFVEIIEKNKINAILYTNKYIFSNFKDKNQLYQFILALIYFYMDVLNLMNNRKVDVFHEFKQNIEDVIQKNEMKMIIKKIDALNECRKNINYNANLGLAIDKLIIDMVGG